MNAQHIESPSAFDDVSPVLLLELAFFALDQAHRLASADAARHFDAAAMAIVKASPEARAYISALGGSSDSVRA